MQLQLFTVVAVGAAWTPASPVSLSRAGRVAPGVRTAVRLQASDENSALDLEALAKLRERISRIQQSGLATPAQAYFDIATEKPPQRLMREFFMETEPRVQQAMQDAIVSLLGNLPPLQFDSRVSTTGDKLVALMLQLQMTGYMLRNAEYVTKLRELLDIRTRSVDEFRKAFNRLDEDGSGYLEMGEVQSLMDSFYEGDATAPPYEANALMRLLDANRDGRISWDEFAAALGARKDSGLDPSLKALTGAADGPVTGPQVSGTISVMLEGGKEVQIDAAAYMEQLKAEAEVLRKELNLVKKQEARAELATTSSLSAYVATLPQDQLQLLTRDMSPEVKEAMQMVIKYIFKVPGDDDESERDLAADDQVTIEQNKMRQLCMYQLVLGYRMREAEAKGEADNRLGR